MKLHAILVLLPSAYAFQIQFPFKIPKLFSSEGISFDAVENPPLTSATPRIAIVGAGAGGTSAAFWISKAKERFGLDIEIDVYESNDYIGGSECRGFHDAPLLVFDQAVPSTIQGAPLSILTTTHHCPNLSLGLLYSSRQTRISGERQMNST